jgi:hypothetical protein
VGWVVVFFLGRSPLAFRNLHLQYLSLIYRHHSGYRDGEKALGRKKRTGVSVFFLYFGNKGFEGCGLFFASHERLRCAGPSSGQLGGISAFLPPYTKDHEKGVCVGLFKRRKKKKNPINNNKISLFIIALGYY